MRTLIQKAKAFYERNNIFFTQNQELIFTRNMKTLTFCAKFFSLFLFGYGILMIFLFQSIELTLFYLLFLVGSVAILYFSHQCTLEKALNPKKLQRACMAFVILVLSFTIAISVFPFPSRPGIFYPIAYILVSVLFYFSYGKISLTLGMMTMIYLVLVAFFKTPEAASYDFFSCMTVCFLNCFLLYIITDLRLKNGEVMQQLQLLSNTDLLTGVLNRRGAQDIMLRNFRRCQTQQIPCAVLMIDIDDFKMYNDSFGHLAGDQCLEKVGQLLLSFARDEGIIVSRFGGEEFVLLLPNCSDKDARRVSFDLLEKVRELSIPNKNGNVTISVGVAVKTPLIEDTLDLLISKADEMLYEVKNNGKNDVKINNLDLNE